MALYVLGVRCAMSRAVLVLFLGCTGLVGCGRPPVAPPAPPAPPDRSVPIAPVRAALVGMPEALSFPVPLASAQLSIGDLDGGRGLDEVRRARGASLAINAGFFDHAFVPEGLVVSEGVIRSPLRVALSGGVVAVRDGRAHLFEAESYVHDPATDFAVQCRPRLVVDGHNNLASDTGRRAARTALCLRDAGQMLDLVVVPAEQDAGPTLYELAEALIAHGCHDALNLDGGPSTGAFWNDPSGSGALAPPGPVRQGILVLLGPRGEPHTESSPPSHE
jgi:hypothetical protein